jgi:hypothetical protein
VTISAGMPTYTGWAPRSVSWAGVNYIREQEKLAATLRELFKNGDESQKPGAHFVSLFFGIET